MYDSLLRWIVHKLNNSFGLEASDDIVQYIISIDNADEIVEYVGDLLHGTEGNKEEFVDELVERWRLCRAQTPELIVRNDTMAGLDNTPKNTLKKSKRKGRNKQEVVTVCQPEPVKTPIDLMKAQESSGSASVKKKSKFVNLYTKGGQDKLAVLLPGRHSCECLAQKHKLINNCLSCGHIVCEQEGSGPCFFCGSLTLEVALQKMTPHTSFVPQNSGNQTCQHLLPAGHLH